jgi:Holliday junction resolvase RusA-like endonuclease
MSTLTFQVYGEPVPQGSTRAFIPKGWNRPIITAANKKTKPWRQEIAGAALAAMEKDLLDCAGKNVPFRLAVTFRFQKPKSTKKTVLEKVTKPDTDKLIRSVLDALTGIVWTDDSQVVEIHARKEFGIQPGAKITFWEIEDLPVGVPVIPNWIEIPF